MIPSIRTIRLSHMSGAELNAVVTQEPLLIGRSHHAADLICPWDGKMSRRHGRVWLEGAQVWYEDLGSSNGSWLGKSRLERQVALEYQNPLLLGETVLSLVQPTEAQTIEDGMTLQLRQRVSRQDFAGALEEVAERPDVLKTLAHFVDQLLGAAALDEIAPCLRSLYHHIPTAQNIFLIGPPSEGELEHLIDPHKLNREGTKVGRVSRSLAKMAIARGEALLFSESDPNEIRVRESTRLKGIHSAVYVPLLSSTGSVLGVLCVDSPHSTLPLHQENFQLLKSAGALISARLDGERLRQQAQKQEIESRELEARRETLVNFLKIASHDLKNPLTVIKMCGVIIDRLSQDEKITDLCARILDAERRAEQLIATYLEVSRVETSQIDVNLQKVDVRAMVEQEFQFLEKAHQRKERKISLENALPSGTILADPQKLEQVLNNLIGNAIKYGSANPKVRVESMSDGRVVVISVSDDGMGISSEDQTKLFAQFQRVGQTRHIPGTGLGLWLSNILVQAHGGTMWVDSEPGSGSTFSFSLPQDQSSDATIDESPRENS